ncbi:MAG: hypothetical protein R3F41_19215 [Gammaproteobacteria bacterium]|nr:hypothetical protein [Pseudomonadales bacterium]MCP5346338.1 hypothetical protein [Pseudomonadales bacterium]
MLILLIIIATFALLALLVFGLHRYQLSMAQSNADLHDPLPPLDNITLDPNLPDLDFEEELSGPNRSLADRRSVGSDAAARQPTPAAGIDQDDNSGQQKPFPADETAVEKTEILFAAEVIAEGQASSRDQESDSDDDEDTFITTPEPDVQSKINTRNQDGETTEINPAESDRKASYGAEQSGDQNVAQQPHPDEIYTSEVGEPPVSRSGQPGQPDLDGGAEPVTREQSPAMRDGQPSPAENNLSTATGSGGFRETDDSPDAADQEVTQISVPEVITENMRGTDSDPIPVSHATTGQSETTRFNVPDSADADNIENWQEQIGELKRLDRLDEALRICQEQLPLWSAYQQASLIHRARIKQHSQDGQPIEEELRALYNLAAQASFLHDRVKGLPNLPLSQLKQVDLEEISRLEMPYPQIGYNELRLIKKTDIKLLLECWGKPKAHLKPRELHGETWKSLIARRQTTLF